MHSFGVVYNQDGAKKNSIIMFFFFFFFKLLLFVLLISTLMCLYMSEFVSGSPLKPTSAGSVFAFQLIVSLKTLLAFPSAHITAPVRLNLSHTRYKHTLHVHTHTNINTVPAQWCPEICFEYRGFFFFFNWKLTWKMVDFYRDPFHYNSYYVNP